LSQGIMLSSSPSSLCSPLPSIPKSLSGARVK
jgi:hypothetical protein